MPEKERARIGSIADQIRAYLGAHPRATDTLEGITGWWLPQQETSVSPDLVQGALDYLEAQGEVVRTRSADGQMLYSSHALP